MKVEIRSCEICGTKLLSYQKKYCSRGCYNKIAIPKLIKRNKTKRMRNIISERNKNSEFIKKCSEGLKKHFKNNPRVNEKWYVDKYGKDYIPKKLKHSGIWKRISIDLRKAIPFCERCFKKGHLDVHHIKPFALSKDNSYENLVVLCRKCHSTIEHTAWQIKNLGFSWDDTKQLVKSCLSEQRLIFEYDKRMKVLI